MEQFQRHITFIQKVFYADKVSDTCDGWLEEPVTKFATFKELSRTDKSQHKLHFSIVGIFEHFGAKEGEEIKIDSDGLYDLTIKAIKTLLITDKSDFTDADKTEFMNDSGAIFDFGMWLLGNKIAPFFSTFNKTSKK